jgi:predicted nuclease with RNAse H fold
MINTTSIAYPEGCMVVWVCDRLVAWESGLDEMGRSSLRPSTTKGFRAMDDNGWVSVISLMSAGVISTHPSVIKRATRLLIRPEMMRSKEEERKKKGGRARGINPY